MSSVLRIGWSLVKGVWVSPAKRAFIASGVERGLSANQIYNALKGVLLGEGDTRGIRRQVCLALVREIKEASEKAIQASLARPEDRLRNDMIQSTSRHQLRQYSYWGKVTMQNRDTGERFMINVNFSGDRVEYIGDIYSAFADIARKASGGSPIEIVGMMITAILRSDYYVR